MENSNNKTKLTKEFAIKVDYNGKEIISDFKATDNDGVNKVRDMLDSIFTRGKAENLVFKNGDTEYYFPKQVLMNSIISIVVRDNDCDISCYTGRDEF